MDKEQQKQIKQIATEVFQELLKQSQYSTGPTPFHTHNNIDSTNFPFLNLSDVPKTYKGQASKSVTVKANESGLEFTSGGGGGSPGGNDTNVQFNDSGSFGGSDEFDWDDTNKILILDKGTGYGDGVAITGGTSDLYIKTDDMSADSSVVGNIAIFGGTNTGNGASNAGGVSIVGGDGLGTGGSPDSIGGSISIVGGSSRSETGGGILLRGGSTTGTGVFGGDIVIESVLYSGFGTNRSSIIHLIGNVVLDNNTSGGAAASDVAGTGATGTLWLGMTADPSGNPGYGGILYTNNTGELVYIGASGTSTVIAPA